MQSIGNRCRTVALLVCLFSTLSAFATITPTGVTATATSSSNINLNWTDNNSDEIGYTFRFDTSSSFANATYVWTGGPNVTSWTHSGRSAATTYYYQVKAEGATDAQDSAFSATAAATTMPGSLAATAVSGSQINLSWTGNASNTSITGYTIATNTSSSFTGASYQFVSGAGATSFSKTGLASGTTYYFAIKAEGTSDTYDSPWTSFVSATTTSTPAPISTHFYGINAWMPYQIGPHLYYGNLGNEWTNIANSSAKIMRYGGHGVDQYADPDDTGGVTLPQYLALVDNMQSRGIEPVLAVPVLGSTYTPAKAAEIVQYINVTYARNVKYWVIGNEPELSGYNYTTSGQVASYIRSFASAMKAVDPTIRIVGPELAWYDSSILNGLTQANGTDDITGTDANGRYYIDYISFHQYNGFDGTQTRSQVTSVLTQSGGFNDNLATLEGRIASCNLAHNRTGANAVKIAITEANVNYANTTTDSVSGNGAKSFVGGQFWAELMGIAMKHHVDFVTFWSAIEGSTTSGNELGYIGADQTTLRPSYYHFQMLAQNFRGSVASATDNQALVKTFASKDTDQVAVLIMNQELSTSFNYTVRLDTNPPAGGNTLVVNVDAGLPIESTGTISSQSTILLVFDATGTLKKKIEYKLAGQADSNLPPAVTTY